MKRAVFVFVSLIACSTPGPEQTLEAYQDAVRTKDWSRAHALSDQTTRSLVSPDELGEAVESGGVVDATQHVGERHVFELADGRRVVLVREKEGWRVESGAVEIARTDTPEAALRTLFLAVEQGRLDVIRSVIPTRHLDAFADDAALRAHVERVAPRIRAAAEALTGGVAKAQIDGDTARLTYAEGKTVSFELERGTWRVLDIE